MVKTILKIQHKTKPKTKGITQERKVHLKLPVSFFMVKIVVAQGQWNNEKTRKFKAVIRVQPFSVKILPIEVISSIIGILPTPVYIIIVKGRIISAAGRPKIKAARIVPSSPIISPIGSKILVKWKRILFSPIVTFASSFIIIPAGTETVMARTSIFRVLSKKERTSTDIRRGFLYGGSSNKNDDEIPLRIVLDKMRFTKKVIATEKHNIRSSRTLCQTVEKLSNKVGARNKVITAIIIGNLPLQGINEFVKMAKSRSLLESIILHPFIAAALQPSPIHIVSACFPQEEHF